MKYEDLLESVSGLARQISQLHVQIARQQEPIVRHLIATRSRDRRAMERTLDQLLDVACHDERAWVRQTGGGMTHVAGTFQVPSAAPFNPVEIASRLHARTGHRRRTAHGVCLLQCRTTLISAAVTGKIDVLGFGKQEAV